MFARQQIPTLKEDEKEKVEDGSKEVGKEEKVIKEVGSRREDGSRKEAKAKEEKAKEVGATKAEKAAGCTR